MLTVENEYFIRLLLLIFKGGTSVLRQIFIKKIEDAGLPLHAFLYSNKSQIDKLKEDKVLTLKQYNILFPSNGKMTNSDNYDISLLSCLLLNIFSQNLERSEVKAIEHIRILRNDIQAHYPNDSIDHRTFFRKWNQLHTSIDNLRNGLSREQSENLSEVVRSVGDDPIEIKQALKDIRAANSTTDPFIEHVSQQLDTLSLLVQQMNRSQEKIRDHIKKNENCSIVIIGEVTISSENPEAAIAASRILIEKTKKSTTYISRLTSKVNDGVTGITRFISNFVGRIISYFWSPAADTNNAEQIDMERPSQRNVTALVQDISTRGGDIEDVQEGSVLLYIRCHSVHVASELLNYFQSSDIVHRLNDIAKCLTEEVGSCIHLSANIQEESLRQALLYLQHEENQEFSKKVRFSIKCENATGVTNVVKLMEGKESSNRMSAIAKDLSDEVGYSVTLRSSVDKDPLRQFIVENENDNEDIEEAETRDDSATEYEKILEAMTGQFLKNKNEQQKEKEGFEHFYHDEQDGLSFEKDNKDTVPIEIADDPYTRRLYAKALQDGKETDKYIRINFVGNFAQGKTTLIRRLVGQNITSVESTNGIDVDRYICKLTEDGNIYCEKPDSDDKSNIFHRHGIISDPLEKDEGYNNEDKPDFDETVNAYDETKTKHEDLPVKLELNEGFRSTNVNRKGTNIVDMEKEVTCHFWDFAGQYIYYVTHTMFYSRNAVYILVMDLSKDLESIICHDEFPVETGDRNMEFFIKFWMNSIHSFVGTPTSSNPPVILVGTHTDKLPGDTQTKENYIKNYFDRVRKLFEDTDVIKHIHQNDFAVNNMDSTDAAFESLKREIIKLGKETSNDDQVPAQWLPLEKTLQKRTSENIITFDEIKRMDARSTFPLVEKEQIKMFLQYHHSKGTLLFFDEEPVSEYVVINPQYLIDAFTCIISSEKFCKKNPNARQLRRRLVKEAVLEQDLIDSQLQLNAEKRFMDNKEILLSFLVKNHIISEVFKFDEQSQTSEKMGWYIIPSLLRKQITQNMFSDFVSGKTPSSIRIVLQFDNSVVVPMICHRLFAAALGKWPVASFYNQCLLFEDFACVMLDRYQVGIIQMNVRDKAIDLQVLGLGCPVRMGDIFRRFSEAVVNHEFRRFAEEERIKPYTLNFRCNDQSHGIEGGKLTELNFLIGGDIAPYPNLDNHPLPTKEAKLEWFLQDSINIDDIPKKTLSDKQLSKLSLSIGEYWQMLGVALGLHDKQIRHIIENHSAAVMRRYYLLLTWKNKQSDKATLDVLVEAMKTYPNVRIDWDIVRNIIDEMKDENPSTMG